MSSGSECRIEGCQQFSVSSSSYCAEHLFDKADEERDAVPDDMIARASIPNAAELLRRATKKGLIKPTSSYITAA